MSRVFLRADSSVAARLRSIFPASLPSLFTCKEIILTLHTAHCTLHTAHCTLHTAHYTLNNACFTLHTAHYTFHTAHRPLKYECCTLSPTDCTLHTSAHGTLPTAHYTLHTAHQYIYLYKNKTKLKNTCKHIPRSQKIFYPHCPLWKVS